MAKIINESGWYWNAENNCWTVAKEAATEYDEFDELPLELPASNQTGNTIDLDPDGNNEPAYYAEGDSSAKAWVNFLTKDRQLW
jgi:hypothetical protein